MTWTIEFPDDRLALSADTPEQLLNSWRLKSWQPWTTDEWPEVLVKRAFVWSSHRIDPNLPAGELLVELDKAGLIRLTVTPTERSK